MFSFYSFSSDTLLIFLMVTVIGAAVQAVTVTASFSRHKKSFREWLFTLNEFFILIETVIFSLMITHVITNKIEMRISGYLHNELSYILFAIIFIMSVSICIIRKNAEILIVIPVLFLILPFWEDILYNVYPIIFMSAVIFILIRAIYHCILFAWELKQRFSAFSVKQAMDSLDTGLLYCETNGTIHLVNRCMQKLMTLITGSIQRNGIDFHKAIQAGETIRKPVESPFFDNQRVYILDNGSVWLFSEHIITFNYKHYLQISAIEVTEQWQLTQTLQKQETELRLRSEQLAVTIANIDVICREEELFQMNRKVHDTLAQQLAIIMQILRSKEPLPTEILATHAENILKEVIDNVETNLYDITDLFRAYKVIGVDVRLHGTLPEHEFFIDFVREALSNAVRHGFATEVDIVCDGESVSVSNKGFLPSEKVTEGGGISEMRRRLALLGGRLTIETDKMFKITAYTGTMINKQGV